jgi:hypothetical protein
MITPDVLSWQWSGYPTAHGDRRNLLMHALTVPIFWAGLAQVVATPLFPVLLISGLASLGLAFLVQGIGHRLEVNAPQPFRSPVDLFVRFFLEQTVNFPRFVLSGGFARAWRRL